MPELGRKYTCYSCHTKFYDLNKPTPVCPKCGADQRDAEEAPVSTSSRSRARVVEEPPEEPEFEPEGGPAPAESDEDEEIVTPEREEEAEEEDDDEEEEEY